MELGEGLRKAIAKLTGATIIDAKAIKEFNKELQKALLSADVEVNLVFEFTKNIEKLALSSKLPPGVSAKDYIINSVYEELAKMMGTGYSPEVKPKRILMLGIYGAGKTTMSAKLAKFYRDRGMSVGLICCDTMRPAAYEQLETLSKQAGAAFFGIKGEQDVRKIIGEGVRALKDKNVLICDSSGRSALDAELSKQLSDIASEFRPDESFLVINADTGQVAGSQAREFGKAVKLSGVIVTKLDGSGKGGGALSAVHAANVNIAFVGTGEKLNAVELYDSKKYVGRLLGVPDLEGLVGKVQEAIKEAGVEEEEIDIQHLDFDTFYKQLKTMSKMGPMKNVLGMLGLGNGQLPNDVVEQSEEKLKRYKVIIESMTKAERKDEKLLHDASRVKRIAKGSGTDEKSVRDMIADFNKMRKTMDKLQNDRGFRKSMSKYIPGL